MRSDSRTTQLTALLARRVLLAMVLTTCGTPVTGQTFRIAGDQPNWISVLFEPGRNIVDLNRDGAPDLIHAVTIPGLAMRCYMNDGAGVIGAPVTTSLPAHVANRYSGLTFAGLVDLDDDGDLDVVGVTGISRWPSTLPRHVWVSFLNDGHGAFTGETRNRFAGVQARSVVFLPSFDANGDGAPDLLMQGASEPHPSLAVNDGAGNFTEVAGAFWGLGGASDVAIADFDLDGDLDIVQAESFGPHCVVWLNDGAGHFTSSATFPATTTVSDAVEVHDFDGDGYPDILFAITRVINHPGMEIWINDRNGGFRLDPARFQLQWPSGGYVRNRFDLVDLDMDGDRDIYLWGTLLEAFLDDGTGHFVDGVATLGLGTLIPRPTHALDMDRDGDPDLVSPTVVNPGTWWANTHRNVFTDSPAVGGTLHVDLYAPPGNLATYLLGLARSDVFVPGVGWAGLDPRLAAAWPTFVQMPAARTASLTLPVPNDPNLRGASLWAQAVDLDLRAGPTLGNLWSISIQ